MRVNDSDPVCFLDQIKMTHGNQKLKKTFREIGRTHREMAAYFLNDKGLSFNSLFILTPEIEALSLYDELNSRNIIALKMCAKILKNKNLADKVNSLSPENIEMIHSVLKWMLISGSRDDGSNNQFDQLLDKTAALLITTHKDKTILPVVADMIFKRYRKGLLIHDLVWAFFQSKDPYTLRLIAEYLKSPEEKDVELCCQLLNLNPDNINKAEIKNQYDDYLGWLDENFSYLYFTGESFQLTGSPVLFRVDLDSKVAKTGLGGELHDYYRS